ncbi:MAG TPA: hypothetical protein VND93_22320 [Myxococcales bacterium]|nr:hypothetical protein [Myxococcales bacterium]
MADLPAWPDACIRWRVMPRHFMLRFAPVAAVMALTACPSVNAQVKGELNSAAVDQWRVVQSESPQIAAAYLQSLIALLEEAPERVSYARQQALSLARQAGVVTARPRACKSCPMDTEARAYLACLAERLRCLQAP